MATLWIRQYSKVDAVPIAREPGDDLTPVTYSTSAQSTAFAVGVRYIAVISDAAFHYVVGDNPTATTNALKVPANTLTYISVVAGHKIAAIAAA